MLENLQQFFQKHTPAGIDYANLRYLREDSEILSVSKEIPEPVEKRFDQGVMITVVSGDAIGYSATCDISESGIKSAFANAIDWCEKTKGRMLPHVGQMPRHSKKIHTDAEVAKPWDSISQAQKIDMLVQECKRLKIDPRIVNYQAMLWQTRSENIFLTSDGAEITQNFDYLVGNLSSTANKGAETQTRSLGGMHSVAQQGGLEVLDAFNFFGQAERLSTEAITLLEAPSCPSGKMDLLLSPDQMILQIHESIGHPLEMDRILGDERNYAGTSFVQIDDFGKLKYGSDLMNVTYDPTMEKEFNTFAFDDDGQEAVKTHIIKDGVLQSALGGYTSQKRSDIPGVANSRACSWNRPTMDRITNLNLEPGNSSMKDMISSVEKGVWMQSNNSWSIDDARNKFQFGCEWAQLIEDGQLTTVVKNAGYRSITVPFWNALKMVGDQDTFEVLGTPFCGKGEPNQVVRVGHATPAALFDHIEVFGS